jgi:hypothetical protein
MSRRPAPTGPHVRRLCAAYLNEDWRTFGPRPEDAVARFAADLGPAEREAAAREVDRLLARGREDAALRRALDHVRCGYDPAADGRTARDFLEAVRTILRGTGPA